MAVKTAYVMFNGTKVAATLNEETGNYEATITAPAESSWSQPDHVYLAEVHAEDNAGNAAVVDSTSDDYGDQLKIRVLEKTKPTAQITKPTEGSVLGANEQDIVLVVKDAGGSGLNLTTVVFNVNGKAVAADTLTWTDGEDGAKTTTYHATGLTDGNNTVDLTVTDNDGNVSDKATVKFIISTAAPTLNITSPVDKLITNYPGATVSGTAAAGSDSVTVNGAKVTVNQDGTFTTNVALNEGDNTITVVATDSLGKATTVTRTVTLDSTVPVITDVVTEPLTVDSGKTFKITFKVTDAAADAGLTLLTGVSAADLANGKSVFTLPDAAEGHFFRYKVTDADALPVVSKGTVASTANGWNGFGEDATVAGTAGQVVTVVSATSNGANVDSVVRVTLK